MPKNGGPPRVIREAVRADVTFLGLDPLRSMSVAKELLNGLPSEAPDSDREVIERILQGERSLMAVLMRRHNQRVFRTIRSIVSSNEDAEDVVQQAYLAAFAKLAQFRGDAEFSTWLTRIAINEALQRKRKVAAFQVIDGADAADDRATPEEDVYRNEVAHLLESTIDELPDGLRTVFVLRDVEELTTSETAECLGLTQEAVRVRLHRGRRMLRDRLSEVLEAAPLAFRFDGDRCDRIVASVASSLGLL